MDEGRRIARGFRSIPLALLPSANLLEAALEIAHGIDRSVYDSLYLASAAARKCRLVTADRKLFTAVDRSPFAGRVLWVEECPSK